MEDGCASVREHWVSIQIVSRQYNQLYHDLKKYIFINGILVESIFFYMHINLIFQLYMYSAFWSIVFHIVLQSGIVTYGRGKGVLINSHSFYHLYSPKKAKTFKLSISFWYKWCHLVLFYKGKVQVYRIRATDTNRKQTIQMSFKNFLWFSYVTLHIW